MRNPVIVRRIVTLAVAPLLLAALVACQGDDDKDVTSPRAASSPSAGSSGGVAPKPEPAHGEQVDPQDFVDSMSSSFTDSTTARLTMNVSSSGLAMSATGQVDYTGETPAMALQMTAPTLGEGTIDLRLIDRVLYMSMPMLDSSGTFFKIDLNDPDNVLGDSLGEFSSFDPLSTLATFSKGVKSVTLVGDESVDGDETTHYQVTTTTRGLGRSLGNTADLPKEFTYDVWLDGEGRVRKMTADLGNGASVEMEMTDFGEDVDIAAPPAHLVRMMPRG